VGESPLFVALKKIWVLRRAMDRQLPSRRWNDRQEQATARASAKYGEMIIKLAQAKIKR
jgi:hypothetical protein